MWESTVFLPTGLRTGVRIRNSRVFVEMFDEHSSLLANSLCALTPHEAQNVCEAYQSCFAGHGRHGRGRYQHFNPDRHHEVTCNNPSFLVEHDGNYALPNGPDSDVRSLVHTCCVNGFQNESHHSIWYRQTPTSNRRRGQHGPVRACLNRIERGPRPPLSRLLLKPMVVLHLRSPPSHQFIVPMSFGGSFG